jgi:hypothetical protein
MKAGERVARAVARQEPLGLRAQTLFGVELPGSGRIEQRHVGRGVPQREREP